MAESSRGRPRAEPDCQPAVPKDVSPRALSIARLLDRCCRTPGEYSLKIVIPSHSRGPWRVEISRQERIRSLEIERRGEGGLS